MDEMSEGMKFFIASKDLTAALKRLESVSTKNADTLSITDYKGKGIIATAKDESRIASIFIPCGVKGSGSFIVDPNTFAATIKNRGDVEIIFRDSLTVKGVKSRYVADNIPLKAGDVQPLSFGKLNGYSKSVTGKIKNVISDVMLKQVVTEDIFFIIQSKGKRLYLSVADNYHASLVSVRLSKEEIEELGESTTILPLEYANMLSKMEGEVSIKITGNKISIHSDDLRVDLPALPTMAFSVDTFLDMMREMDFTAKIDSSNIKEFMGNIAPLADPTTNIELIIKKAHIEAYYPSQKGTVRDTFSFKIRPKKETDSPLKLDYAHFIDLAKKLSGDMQVGWNSYSLTFKDSDDGQDSAYFINLK